MPDPSRLPRLLLPALALGLLSAALVHREQEGQEPLDFNRDIRPILSDTCFTCHGPDPETRKAGLRLDTPEGIFGELRGGGAIVVPGDREKSELWYRISAEDPEERMPPEEHRKHLGPEQIERIGRWIDEGAAWEEHWAFRPPARPPLPEVRDAARVRSPVDAFLLQRLEREGLTYEPDAAPGEQLRRLSLVLTGIPPTPEEMDAFEADPSEAAWDREVERLLASPRYGEHLARYWMDAARYADTHGLHIDAERSLWRWRDGVIAAFQRNQPFDQFLTEQLAGDLIPDASLEQRIASGFNRNHVTTGEGGLIEEEYRVKYCVDRVDTTATVFLGLTLACAQCHDHKYDPISQKEYYRFFAYFFNTTDSGNDRNALLPPPFVKAPLPEQEEALARLAREKRALERELNRIADEVGPELLAWEEAWKAARPPAARELVQAARDALDEGLVAWFPLNLDMAEAFGTCAAAESREGLVSFVRGSRGPGARFDGQAFLEVGDLGDFEKDQPFSYGCWVKTPDTQRGMSPIARMDESRAYRGWDLYLAGGSVYAHLISSWDGDAIRVNTPPVLEQNRWHHLLVTYDGSGRARGLHIYVDGEAQELTVTHDSLRGSLRSQAPLQIGSRTPGARFTGEIDEVRIYARELGPEEVRALASQGDGGAGGDPRALPVQWEDWWSLGPFPAESGAAALATDFGPEAATGSAVDLEAAVAAGAEERRWTRRPEFRDGAIQKLSGTQAATYLYREFEVPTDRRLILHLGTDDTARLWLDGEAVFEHKEPRGVAPDQDRVEVEIPAGRHRLLFKIVNHGGAYAFFFRTEEEVEGIPLDVVQILAGDRKRRSASQAERLRDWFLRNHSREGTAVLEKIQAVADEQSRIESEIPGTMVMEERATRRPTYVLRRGQYDQKGEEVQPGVPAVLPPPPVDAPPNRLGLAMWMTQPDHPLTARVQVNRLWQMVFGTGLVATSENFGTQGDWPTHPELLDWLAVEFVESGWDIQHLLRLMVRTTAFRQDAAAGPEKRRLDPANRLLARGPRFRLDAEVIRDSALAVSGLLVEKVGGRSVKPYQPPGLWKAVAYGSAESSPAFEPDQGEGLFRRSLYTFWKRTAPPPQMTTLDAPDREYCVVRRARTNTPLQALLLLNDVQYVEAARHLAVRMLEAGGGDPGRAAAWGFRACTARRPLAAELHEILALVDEQTSWYQDHPEEAQALLEVGDTPPPEGDAAELAAWTLAANLLLNLDEFLNL